MPVDSTRTSQPCYEIKVSGRLTPAWAEWFGDLSIHADQDRDGQVFTTLSGPAADQAALFGILNRIRDLGLRLVAVNVISPEIVDRSWKDLDKEQMK